MIIISRRCESNHQTWTETCVHCISIKLEEKKKKKKNLAGLLTLFSQDILVLPRHLSCVRNKLFRTLLWGGGVRACVRACACVWYHQSPSTSNSGLRLQVHCVLSVCLPTHVDTCLTLAAHTPVKNWTFSEFPGSLAVKDLALLLLWLRSLLWHRLDAWPGNF